MVGHVDRSGRSAAAPLRFPVSSPVRSDLRIVLRARSPVPGDDCASSVATPVRVTVSPERGLLQSAQVNFPESNISLIGRSAPGGADRRCRSGRDPFRQWSQWTLTSHLEATQSLRLIGRATGMFPYCSARPAGVNSQDPASERLKLRPSALLRAGWTKPAPRHPDPASRSAHRASGHLCRAEWRAGSSP